MPVGLSPENLQISLKNSISQGAKVQKKSYLQKPFIR